MEVLCIDKNAVNHTTNRSFIKAQQVCFPPAVENSFQCTQIFQQHVSNLQGDIKDLLAKSHPYCQRDSMKDIVQQVLAQKLHFWDSSSHYIRKAQHTY